MLVCAASMAAAVASSGGRVPDQGREDAGALERESVVKPIMPKCYAIQAFVGEYHRFEFKAARIAAATSLPSDSQPALLK
jgi:hypothetical protein